MNIKIKGILLVIILIIAILFFLLFGKKNQTIKINDNYELPEMKDDYSSYALHTDKDINNLTNLDFASVTHESYGDGSIYAYIDKGLITYKNINGKEHSFVATDATSLIYSCNCKICDYIAFINSNNELYYVGLNSKNDSYDEPKLLVTDAKEITKVSYGRLRYEECGGYYIFYKDLSDNINLLSYLGKNKIGKTKLDNLDYKVYGYREFNVSITNNERLFSKFLLDDNSEKLVAKKVYHTAIDGEKFYIIGVDDYLYFFDKNNIESLVAKKISDSKIKDIKGKGFDVIFEYENGETLQIYAETAY